VIVSVEGIVADVLADSLVIETGGIGYQVFVAPSVVASAAASSKLKLHTYHVVREDLQALYGFRTPEERGFFTLLLSVTGVGPKVALSIVGSRPVADLQLAILTQDQAVLVAVSGVGKRLAERILLELREKVAAAGTAAAPAARGTAASVATEGEVVAALQALGYTLGEARQAARIAIAESGVGTGLEDRVKTALRTLLRD
jgi:Holliday junction DNA helicase RuvA